jgi:sigma-B regulation protein RsbU (phosphoserine phosphatase)
MPLDIVGGFPLGVEMSAVFDEAAIILASGQMLLLYTDGIEEAQDPSGQFFGEEGIARILRTSPYGSAGAVLEGIHLALTAHQRGRRPEDDQTLIAIYVRPICIASATIDAPAIESKPFTDRDL